MPWKCVVAAGVIIVLIGEVCAAGSRPCCSLMGRYLRSVGPLDLRFASLASPPAEPYYLPPLEMPEFGKSKSTPPAEEKTSPAEAGSDSGGQPNATAPASGNKDSKGNATQTGPLAQSDPGALHPPADVVTPFDVQPAIAPQMLIKYFDHNPTNHVTTGAYGAVTFRPPAGPASKPSRGRYSTGP